MHRPNAIPAHVRDTQPMFVNLESLNPPGDKAKTGQMPFLTRFHEQLHAQTYPKKGRIVI